MKKYTLTLDEGQLILLRDLTAASIETLQNAVRQAQHHPDPVVHAEITLDAFSRGPKLLAILQEYLALGPEPMTCDEEET